MSAVQGAGLITKPAWLDHLEALAEVLDKGHSLPPRPGWLEPYVEECNRPALTLIKGGRDA